MASSQVLSAEKRTALGSRASRAIRGASRIPANIQGGGDHFDITIDEREFLASRRAHVHLYDIKFDGGDETAVVHELQWDTFGDRILHVEFRKVVRGVELESEVELIFAGNPKTGVASHLVDMLLIQCIPSLIPDNLEVSVDGLEEHDHIKAGDIALPAGISLACEAGLEVAVIIGAHGHQAEDDGDEDESEEAPREA